MRFPFFVYLMIVGATCCAEDALDKTIAASADAASDPMLSTTSAPSINNVPFHDVKLTRFAEEVLRAAGKPDVKVLANDPAVSDCPVSLDYLPKLSAVALIQCMASRHGCVATFDAAKKQLSLEKIETAWGAKDAVEKALIARCEIAVKSEEDLGKLSYLLGSLLAFPDKGIRTLTGYIPGGRKGVLFVILNVLAAAPKQLDGCEAIAGAIFSGDAECCAAALRLGFSKCDSEELSEFLDFYIENFGPLPDGKRVKKTLRDAAVECLKGELRLRAENVLLLEKLQTIFEGDAELKQLVEEKLKDLPKDVKVIRTDAELNACITAAADPKFKVDLGGGYGGIVVFADIQVDEMFKAMNPILLGKGTKADVAITKEAAQTAKQNLTNLPMLSPLAILQCLVARHGMIVKFDNKVATLLQIEDAWGARKKVFKHMQWRWRESYESEQDLGKIGYFLSSYLALGDDGSAELYRLIEHSSRADIRYLALQVLVNASKPVDLPRILPSMVDSDQTVRVAAMRLCFTNADLDAVIKALNEKQSVIRRARHWKDLLRSSVVTCLGYGDKYDPSLARLEPKHIPLLKTLKEVLSDDLPGQLDAEIEGIEKAWKLKGNEDKK